MPRQPKPLCQLFTAVTALPVLAAVEKTMAKRVIRA